MLIASCHFTHFCFSEQSFIHNFENKNTTESRKILDPKLLLWKVRPVQQYCSGLVSQFCDVVLVRAHLAQENPRESGFWNWERMGRGWKWGDQFRSNLGPGWMGSYHSEEGFQVSKRNRRKAKRDQKGESRKQGDCAINALSTNMHVHNDCL
jgi:hypothetical protein